MTQLTTVRRAMSVAALAALAASAAVAAPVDSVRSRLAAVASSIHDIQGKMIVHPASRKDAKEIGKGIIDALDKGLKDASVAYVRPDKYRAQGKVRGVDVTYVTNGNTMQVIAPAMMLKQTQDLSTKRVRKQSTLDMGFPSDALWIDYNITLAPSPAGQIRLRLVTKGTHDKRFDLVTLDAKSLKVITRERHDRKGVLKSRNVYGGYRTFGKVIVATQVKVYSGDGGYAGSIELRDVKVNAGVPASVFTIK